MKMHAPSLLSLLLAFTGLPSSAGEPPLDSVRPKDASLETEGKSDPRLWVFWGRLEAAVESRQLDAIAALYQTNDVTAVELKSELARWRQIVAEGVKPKGPFFKVLSHLPPESHAYWTTNAHRLTRHEVTCFVIAAYMVGGQNKWEQMTLPLVLVGDSLLIVPSEKVSTKGIEQGGPATGSQPIRPETNRTSGAAGSRRSP
jgi:hypothetical protein